MFHLHRRAGNEAAAKAQLAALQQDADAAASEAEAQNGTWTHHLAEFLSDELPAPELLATARSSEASGNREGRLCEAWTHIGLAHARAGRVEPARAALARALATGAREKWEWSWSLRELRDLETSRR